MNARFSTYTLGNAWILIEPILLIVIFSVLFGLRGRGAFGYADSEVFILAGFVPFKLIWQTTLKKVMSSKGAARGLLGFRQIRLFDVMIARSIVEICIFLVAGTVLVAGMVWIGFDAVPGDTLLVLFYCLLFWLLAFGIGVLACVLGDFAREIEKLIALMSMPLMILSAVFYPMTIIPARYHQIMSYNPLVHANELIREAWLPLYTSPVADFEYLMTWILCTMALGIASYRLRWRRMVAS